MSRRVARLRGKVYESIDTLPVYNWWKVHDGKGLRFLLIKTPARPVRGLTLLALERCWQKLYDEYIERMGFAESFIEIMERRKDVARLKLQFIETGDRSLRTLIRASEQDLQQMQDAKEKQQQDFYDLKTNVEAGLGYPIDPHRTTVSEFYAYIAALKKRGEGNGRKRQDQE